MDRHPRIGIGARRDVRHERGAAALEFVGVMPLVLLLMLAALQCGLAGWTVIETTQAARNAARAASQGGIGREAAVSSLPGSLAVEEYRQNGFDTTTVTLRVRIPSVIGAGIGSVTRTVSMPRTHR